jgi:UDP-N-acetylglucosamine/UDP-N-acetylgalactosamine diphosphorylase
LALSLDKSATSLYHKAFKKVEHCDLNIMEIVTPEKENAWKFELFIQNFLPTVEPGKLGVMEVDRTLEFAPIKNADSLSGVAVDSPASARLLLLAEST